MTTSNPCRNTPCKNGRCFPKGSSGGFYCTCYNRYRGDLCDKIDFCYNQPCKNDAKCMSLQNGFRCNCLKGFTGRTCESDIDECLVQHSLCVNGGTCENLYGSYR